MVPLGISPSYVKGWMPADGFRELYQNWYVPASFARPILIIEKLDLDRQSFQPFSEDHGDHLSIIAPDQNLADQPAESESRRALGFIQYEKKTGRITIANSCMQLPINALSMVFSIKRAHYHR